MIGYVSSGTVVGAATKTILSLLATSTRRPKLRQLIIGSPDTPADNAAEFAIRIMTADGTGTAATTFGADPGDGAPSVTAKKNYTAEPTYSTGNVAEISLNQRASMVWDAAGMDAEIRSAVGAGAGIGVQMISGPAVNYTVTAVWEE